MRRIATNIQPVLQKLRQIQARCAKAAADLSLIQMPPPPPKRKRQLRGGRWFPEEEAYAARLVNDFMAGTLPSSVKKGTMLRVFLAQCLNCDPLRISKKYAGKLSMRKLSYQPNPGSLMQLGKAELKAREREMKRLHDAFQVASMAIDYLDSSSSSSSSSKNQQQ